MTTERVLSLCVPEPAEDEAPSAWLSRLALAQGCSMRELLNFLDIRFDGDPDLQLHGVALSELRWKCGLPSNAFMLADRTMSRIANAGLGGELLSPGKGTGMFRFCPLCLKSRSPMTFPIEWRFLDWRYCPHHNCLMEKACRTCRRATCHPLDVADSKAGRQGYASQSRCSRCAADLRDVVPRDLSAHQMLAFTWLEADWLRTGVDLIRALSLPSSQKLAPAGLRRAFEIDCLPTHLQWSMIEVRLSSTDWPDRGSKFDDRATSVSRRKNWIGRIFDFRETVDVRCSGKDEPLQKGGSSGR